MVQVLSIYHDFGVWKALCVIYCGKKQENGNILRNK